MNRTPLQFVALALIVAALIGVLSPAKARAATFTMTIDPVASWLTISGSATVAGDTFYLAEQGPGALTSILNGTLVADSDLATTISFPGGSSVIPDVSNNWQPAAGGNAGTQPAQYGPKIDIPFFGTIFYAAHDSEFDATSGSLPLTPDFIFPNQFFFDATQLTIELLTATVDWNQFDGFDQGTEVFANETAPNYGATLGFLDASSNLIRVIIPIHAGEYGLQFGAFTANVTIDGQISATVSVPESSSWTFALIGFLVVCGVLRLTFRQANSTEVAEAPM